MDLSVGGALIGMALAMILWTFRFSLREILAGLVCGAIFASVLWIAAYEISTANHVKRAVPVVITHHGEESIEQRI